MCQCSSNCDDCSLITLEQIAGPTGPAGPSGTTVLDWTTTTLTSATTGSDVLVYSYTLPADELPTNGDELQIDITGAWLDDAVRYIKLDINGSTITTIAQQSGTCSNGVFTIRGVVTRVSNTSTEGFFQGFWNNGSTVQSFVGYNYTTDFSANQTVRFYINQDGASKIQIDSIKIKKAIS